MPATSSMTPLSHHSLLIILFHLHSHDQAPHGRVPYLLSPYGSFPQTLIPHYNWMIITFPVLCKPFTYNT
jgi:hypothetical protein